MAKNQHLGLTLVSPLSLVSESDDWLEIEQPPWPEKPAGGFAAWAAALGKELTAANGLEYQEQYRSHCLEDGLLEVELWVHLSRPDLAYAITASHGLLSEKSRDIGEHVYSETVRWQSSLDLGREIAGKVSARWEGGVIGRDLAFIAPPPVITQTGSVLDWGVVCTGTLRLKYTEEHDTYFLTITPRTGEDVDPDDLSSAYSSTVTAVFAGGEPVVHEVELPEMKGFCGGSKVSVDPDDEEGDCYDLYIKYHKCTGEEISRELVRVACPENEPAEGD